MDSVSVIITSAHEPKTIGKALTSILAQNLSEIEIKEILVVAPDKETLEAAKKAAEKHQKVKLLKDPGKGKPTALNLAFGKALSDILVLTDGDVYVADNALSYLLAPFKDPKVGGTGGRPIPTNSRNSIFGFWSHFLTDSAHRLRLDRSAKNKFLELSGYLLAIKKSPITSIPVATLADDSYLSHLIAKSNLKTAYAPEAKVYVKYPTNLSDWFKQKRRSAFEYWQNSYSSAQSMRSPLKEAFLGFKFALSYPKNFKEVFWLVLLFAARVFLWFEIFFLKLTDSSKNLWVRVKTTK